MYTSPADGRRTYQSDRHACVCCCHIYRLRQRSDISDSHSFARRCRSFKTGSLLIPGLALGRWEVVVYKKRAVPMHCSLFVISGFLSSQGASPQVLSAFAGLTAVFGMGTGGSPQLSPLNFLKGPCPYNCIKRTSLTSLRSAYGSFLRTCFQIPSPTPFGSKRLYLSQALGLLVPVRSVHHCTSTPGLSTMSSSWDLTCFHNEKPHL